MSDSALIIGDTSTVTITFSEAVTNFANADVTVENGTLSTLSSSDGGVTWTGTFTPTSNITDTTNAITLATTYPDVAGNAGMAASSANYTVDTKAPTATITMGDSALIIGDTSTVTIAFSEAVTNFANADVTVENGTLSTLSSSDGGVTWTGTFTPTSNIADTINAITLATTYTDVAGNAGTAASSANYTVDTVVPNLTSVVMADAALIVGDTSLVTFTFSEAVSNFDNSDVTVENGTLSTLSTSNGGLTWTGTFTPTAGVEDAINTITVASTFTDVGGNAAAAGGTSANYTIDTIRPTVAVTSATGNVTVANPTKVITFTFSEDPGTSFVTSDITISGGGTLGTVSGSGLTRTVTYTPAAGANGAAITLSVANGAFTDTAGNTNADGADTNNSISFVSDITAPTGTIDVTAKTTADTTPTITGNFSSRVVGSEKITVTVNGVTYTEGVDSNLIVPNTASGTWSLAIAAGAALNLNVLQSTTYSVVASIVDAVGNTKSDSTANELVVYTDATVAPLPESNYVADTTPTFTGKGQVGTGETFSVQVLNSSGSVIKTFTSATNGGLTMDTTNGTWSISDASWTASAATGVSLLSAGSYTIKSFATVADGSGGQASTTQSFTVVAPIVRTNVTGTYDDTGSQVFGLDDGGYYVFYASSTSTGANGGVANYNLYAQRYNSNGTVNGSVITIANNTGNDEGYSLYTDQRYLSEYDVAVNGDGSFSIMYASNQGQLLNFKTYNALGAQVGTTLTSDPAIYELDPSYVLLADGRYVAMFASGTEQYYNMYMQLFNANGTANGVLQQMTTGTGFGQGFSWYPTYDQASGWYIIDGQSDTSFSMPGNSSVYMGGTTFGMVYSSMKDNGSSSGPRTELYLRIYNYTNVVTTDANNDGQLSTEVKLNSISTGYQVMPTLVALADGTYLGTWVSNHDSVTTALPNGTMDGMNVYSRRFSVNSTTGVVTFLDTTEVMVNTSTNGVNGTGFSELVQFTSAAALNQGGYVVTWTKMTSTTASEVYSQVFDAAGNKIGGETLISDYTGASSRLDLMPSVDALADGGFVVSWTSSDSSGDYINNSTGDVYSVIVNADGTVRGTGDTDAHLANASYVNTAVSGVLTGNDGVNTLDGVAGGALTFNAGADTDLMVVYDTTFTSVDGGAGFDTFSWKSTANLDFSTISSKVDNIEAIHLGDTNANTLTISLADLLAVTDDTNGGTNKTLVIQGGTTDKVDIDLNAATAWAAEGNVTWHGQIYTVYGNVNDFDAALYIQTGITVI